MRSGWISTEVKRPAARQALGALDQPIAAVQVAGREQDLAHDRGGVDLGHPRHVEATDAIRLALPDDEADVDLVVRARRGGLDHREVTALGIEVGQRDAVERDLHGVERLAGPHLDQGQQFPAIEHRGRIDGHRADEDERALADPVGDEDQPGLRSRVGLGDGDGVGVSAAQVEGLQRPHVGAEEVGTEQRRAAQAEEVGVPGLEDLLERAVIDGDVALDRDLLDPLERAEELVVGRPGRRNERSRSWRTPRRERGLGEGRERRGSYRVGATSPGGAWSFRCTAARCWMERERSL